ncbi:hypothetical protein K2W90_03035 [Candidatus Babeliales bacterium]|nr:hypothetical protein [Candidatus Babeliales bacterium]
MNIMMLFIVYQFVQMLLFPLFIPYVAVKNIVARSSIQEVKEQIGIVPKVQGNKPVIWFHALRAGEVLSIERLINEVKETMPEVECYVTASTPEGKQMAEKTLKADYVSLLPYDALASMLLAFDRIKPTAIVVLEHELWPNMIMLAKMKGMPIYLLNAYLSGSNALLWSSLKFVYSSLLNAFDYIFAQHEQAKVDLIEKFDVAPERISSMGDVKCYNVQAKRIACEKAFTQPYGQYRNHKFCTLLLGSIYDGELDGYLGLYKTLKLEQPDLKLIIAPRHFAWKEKLVQEVEKTGYRAFMWDNQTTVLNQSSDALKYLANEILPQHDIVLVCTMGKLFSLHPLADVFCLGGTFVPVGGHNVLEPAVWANPIIVGPHHETFKQAIDQLEQVGGLRKVTDAQLLECVRDLVLHKEKRELMGKKAEQWLEQQADLVTKSASLLFRFLRNSYDQFVFVNP